MKNLVLMTALMVFGLMFNLTADAQGKKIGMKRARAIAIKEAAGKIKSSELEKEDGKWVYSFDIRNAKGTITEVLVDAYTGKIISVEEESAEKEAEEERMEKKKNQ